MTDTALHCFWALARPERAAEICMLPRNPDRGLFVPRDHQTRSSNRPTVWSRLRPRRWASDRNREAVSHRRAIFVRC